MSAAFSQPSGAGTPRLDEVSSRLVGSVFFGTLLQAMRSSPFKGEYGHGGRAEEVFSAQLDAILAEDIGRRMGGRLSGWLIDGLEQGGAGRQGER